MPPIKEEIVKELYLKVMRELSLESESFKSILTENITSSLDDSTATELIALQQEIETRQEEMITLNRDKRSGSIREAEYLEKGSALGEEIDRLQASRRTRKQKYVYEHKMGVSEEVQKRGSGNREFNGIPQIR